MSGSAGGASGPSGSGANLPGGPAAVSAAAQAVHDSAVIVDGCSFFFGGYGELLRASGLTAVNFTVALPMDDSLQAAQRIKEYYAAVRRDPASQIVRTADDIRRCKAEGRFGVIIGCQNSRLIGTDLAWLEVFHTLGLRTLQLTYNERNFVGDGCLEPHDAGLSHFGKRVVRAANDVGLTIDLAHAGVRTTLETIELSEKPCVISHAGVAALVPGARSYSDEVITALAAKGGVFGVTTFPNVNWRGIVGRLPRGPRARHRRRGHRPRRLRLGLRRQDRRLPPVGHRLPLRSIRSLP